MPKIHTVMICYGNPDQTRTRWERDVLPGLTYVGSAHDPVTVVDNSPGRSEMLAEFFGAGDRAYLWQGGLNLLYGPSLNLAVPRVPSDLILYVCARHGRMRDRSWVRDLITPFDDPAVGMSGHLRGSNSPEGVAHDLGVEWIKERFRFTHDDGTGHVPQHVQGGVFMARTRCMLELPFPPEVRHMYTDHYITWAMLKAGYRCADVPGVLSVWRECVPPDKLNGVKYLHDESEGH